MPFTGAGFLFHPMSRVRNVPYDPYLPMLLDGEEFSMAVRMFTHGVVCFLDLLVLLACWVIQLLIAVSGLLFSWQVTTSSLLDKTFCFINIIPTPSIDPTFGTTTGRSGI